MKIKTLLLSALTTLFVASNVYAINLTVDNKPLQLDVLPVIEDGRTLVPLRAIFEELGATVEWNDAEKKVTATLGNTSMELIINDTNAVVNGQTIALDVPAKIINGSTMVPARFVAENFNASVTWVPETETVAIETQTVETFASAEEAPQTVESTPVLEPTGEVEQRTVYITKTGKRYHYDNNCNAGSYIESTLEEAQNKGLTPCEKCVY